MILYEYACDAYCIADLTLYFFRFSFYNIYENKCLVDIWQNYAEYLFI